MFEVTSIRFHTARQTFAPLIDSIVDRCRWNPWKHRRLYTTQATRVRCPSTL